MPGPVIVSPSSSLKVKETLKLSRLLIVNIAILSATLQLMLRTEPSTEMSQSTISETQLPPVSCKQHAHTN